MRMEPEAGVPFKGPLLVTTSTQSTPPKGSTPSKIEPELGTEYSKHKPVEEIAYSNPNIIQIPWPLPILLFSCVPLTHTLSFLSFSF